MSFESQQRKEHLQQGERRAGPRGRRRRTVTTQRYTIHPDNDPANAAEGMCCIYDDDGVDVPPGRCIASALWPDDAERIREALESAEAAHAQPQPQQPAGELRPCPFCDSRRWWSVPLPPAPPQPDQT